MPKINKLPGFRTHIRRGKAGQVWTYYTLDMRGTGRPDINLGSDHAEAVAKYHQIKSGTSPDKGLIREAITRWLDEELPKYTNAKTVADYTRQAKTIGAWCGAMRWDQMTLPLMHEYVTRRSAKTQANREMAVLSIIWGKARLWGMTKLPYPAAGVKGWKNEERARRSPLNEQVFDAVRVHACWTLTLAMDLASATGMRLTDVLLVDVPADGGTRLYFAASKTGKAAYFDAAKSPVLQGVLSRRTGAGQPHGPIIVTERGKRVSEGMLRERWDKACDKAAAAARAAGDEALALSIEGSWMRDHRKLAAKLTGSAAKARELLQHANEATTRGHYFDAAEELEPVR